VQAGDNTSVTGAGSTANPYVVNAVTNCAEVRGCISAGPGITFDSATGVIGADISSTPGNNLVVDANGLFVPAGAATVQRGCGLLGDGSGSAPLRVNVGTWPFACAITANGGDVYCDSSNGRLKTDPPFRARYREVAVNDVFSSNNAVPATEATIDTISVTMTNPDPCRDAFVIAWRQVDVEFQLPANGGAAASGINGDEVNYLKNSGSQAIPSWHSQHSVQHNLVIPAGGTQTISLAVTADRGAAGATYTRVQATIRAWLFSIPLS
jgi:hypothetical protein